MDVRLNERITVTVPEAAVLTGIGETNLRAMMVEDPTFPSFRIGKKIFISVGKLREYFDRKALQRDCY